MAEPKKKPGSKKENLSVPVPASQPEDDGIVELDQAIRLLHTSRTTLYRWIREGRIRAMKAGRQWRFRREDIDRFLAGENPKPALTVSPQPLIDALREALEKLNVKPPLPEPEPLQEAVTLLFLLGIHSHASDIHIAPHGDPSNVKGIVRLRIDGVLHPVLEMDPRLLPHLMERIKMLSGCDVLETVRPQDGRFEMRLPAGTYDHRVSFLPLGRGPSVTIRILPPNSMLLGLDDVGLAGTDRERVEKALNLPNGLILFTGPTGSGKSTCMYAALMKLARPEVKTMSVEDPVEVNIPWVDQTPVRDAEGMTFARAIRAIMRSDPDNILVGEIRDLETLQLCIQAALTGHLVLTTLHADSAVLALIRMRDMGSPLFLIGDTTRLIMSQRLVRRLCPECAQSYVPIGTELRWARQALLESNLNEDELPTDLRRPVGCPRCAHSGYRGRTLIKETLLMSPELASALKSGASPEDLKRLAIAGGMTTLAADAARKAYAGITSLEEAYRVAGFAGI